jgi:hypothetical protein
MLSKIKTKIRKMKIQNPTCGFHLGVNYMIKEILQIIKKYDTRTK